MLLVSDPPELADALPGAERWCRQLVDRLAAPEGPTQLVVGLVGLLEAAGGCDVGNGVRAYLERTGQVLSARVATDDLRRRVLTAALRLHLAAAADLTGALVAAGLSGSPADNGRAERAAYVERVLATRHEAVLAVLASLAGAQLLPGEGDWREVLSG